MDDAARDRPLRVGPILAASHVIGQYRWQDILAHMQAIPLLAADGSAVLLTAAGYGCLTLYDALGLRFAGARVPYPGSP
jgi:hypothetical protein